MLRLNKFQADWIAFFCVALAGGFIGYMGFIFRVPLLIIYALSMLMGWFSYTPLNKFLKSFID